MDDVELEQWLAEEFRRPRNDSLSTFSDSVLQKVQNLHKVPRISTPITYAAYAVAHSDAALLSTALIKHFDIFNATGILPILYKFLVDQVREKSSIEALECLAYCKFDRKTEIISMDDLEIPAGFELNAWKSQRESHDSSTEAGRSTSHSGPQYAKHETLFDDRGKKESYFLARPWILQMLITNKNNKKPTVDTWWPLAIPALLNGLDSVDLAVKTRAISLVDLLSEYHADRLAFSGLGPVFESSIEPALNLLSPLVDPSSTMLIHRPAVLCLGRLAGTSTSRLNFVAREGCLKPFLYTKELVDLTIYFWNTLELFVNAYLKSLTVIHVHGIVKSFNQVLCDPFIDYSPKLIEAACHAMESVIRWSWPRIDQYKYTLLLGLVKANALDSECCKILNPSAQELQRLKTAVNKAEVS